MLSALISEGVVDLVDNSDAQLLAGKAKLLDGDSCDRLRVKLLALPTTFSNSRYVPIAQALRRESHPIVWTDVIKLASSGRLGARRLQSGGPLLSVIAVDRRYLLRIVEKARLMLVPDLDVPVKEAGPLIGATMNMISKARVIGLLKTNGCGVSLISLREFRALHVFGVEIIERYAETARAFAIEMRSVGARPVATLYRANVWRRSDVTRAFGEGRPAAS